MKIKDLLIGIVIGMLIAAPIAWAAGRMTWVNGSGVEMGTTTNPVIIQTN